MKILVLSNLYPPDFLGGYELACKQAVDCLRRRGHEVRVISSVPRVPTAATPDVERLFQLTDVYDPSVNQSNRPLVHLLREYQSNLVNSHNVYILATVVDSWQPDVAYVHNLVGLGGLSLITCLQFLGVPWVWHLGDCAPNFLLGKWGKPIPALAKEFEYLSRGHYISCSARLVDEIREAGTNLMIRPNGVHLVPYWVIGEGSPGRTRFYRPGDTLRMVYAGMISTHKGSDIIVKMASILRSQQMDNFTIEFYGPTADHTIQALIQALELTDHVFLRGVRPQSQLVAMHKDYDLFLFPTWTREPFGIVPIEAAAHGCLPLISQSNGVGEWLVHGVHCLKAERTPEAFAELVGEVYRGQIPLKQLARRACQVILRDFHLDYRITHIEKVLRNAASERMAPLGSPVDAHRLAILAEKYILAQVQVSQAA
jgi:glycogen(starch) synthase